MANGVSQAGVGSPKPSQLAEIKKRTAQKIGKPVTETRPDLARIKRLTSTRAETPRVTETRPNLARIRELTSRNLGKPTDADITTGLDLPTPDIPKFDFTPLGTKIDTTTPEGVLEAGAIQNREATNRLLEKLRATPQESSIERFKRLQTEAGRPELITTRQETFKQVQRVTNLLRNLEQDISERGREVGTLTTAQARRQEAVERTPLTRQLETLNETLQLQNLQVEDIDSQIDKFIQLEDKDQADELNRLKELASLSGLTQDEKEIISEKIKEESEREVAEAKTQSEKQKTLDDGIADLREFATKEGVITEAFKEVVNEAQRRFEAGEDPRTILADVSAAVLRNPIIQRDFQIDRLRKERLARGTARGGTGAKKDKGITITNAQRQKLEASEFSGESGAETFDELSEAAQKFLGFTASQRKGAVEDIKKEVEGIVSQTISELKDAGATAIGQSEIEDMISELQSQYPQLTRTQINDILAETDFKPGPLFGFSGAVIRGAKEKIKGAFSNIF